MNKQVKFTKLIQHIISMNTTLPTSKISKELLTTLPLTSVILPYFGYADECQILMTQLRRASRKLWDKSNHILLRNYPGEDGEETLILQKKLLRISAVHKGNFLKERDTLRFESFMESDLSTLYKLQIYICCPQKSIIREFFKVFREVDTISWTIEKFEIQLSCYDSCTTNRRYMFSSLQCLAKFINTQFEVCEFKDRKYLVLPKIFYLCIENGCLNSYEATKFRNAGTNSAFGGEYSNLYKQLVHEGVETTKFLCHLETNTIGQICERVDTSVFKLKLFQENYIRNIDALKEISDKLKSWHREHQEQRRRLKTIYLKLSQSRYCCIIDDKNCLLEGLIALSLSCKESGLNLSISKGTLKDSNSTSASLCYLVIGNQALVIKKFKCYLYGELLVSRDFIASDQCNIDFNGLVTDVIPLHDTGFENLLKMDRKIIIPVDKILQTKFELEQLWLNKIKSFSWKIRTLSSKIYIKDQLDKNKICEIKALHKDIKIDVDFKGYRQILQKKEKERLNQWITMLKTKKLAFITIQKIYYPLSELENIIGLLHNQTDLESLKFNIKRYCRKGSMTKSIEKLFMALETLPNLKSIDICTRYLSVSDKKAFASLIKEFISRSIGISISIQIGSKIYLDRYSKLECLLNE
ncbi:unnamed protein product [Moneuplotes crassus]|uniref:Uncharacterized protein n=1 Tax=Euplotes crassus TaxID=5936 RepID=A0AAD1Y6U8_EUPCR|nr:unnamed protein product [Moneuplotes crassus]